MCCLFYYLSEIVIVTTFAKVVLMTAEMNILVILSHTDTPITCLSVLFCRISAMQCWFESTQGKVICFEDRLAVHSILPGPRWSSKCGWMELYGLCAACQRRHPARTWSLLWLRPLVSSSSRFSAKVIASACWDTMLLLHSTLSVYLTAYPKASSVEITPCREDLMQTKQEYYA